METYSKPIGIEASAGGAGHHRGSGDKKKAHKVIFFFSRLFGAVAVRPQIRNTFWLRRLSRAPVNVVAKCQAGFSD